MKKILYLSFTIMLIWLSTTASHAKCLHVDIFSFPQKPCHCPVKYSEASKFSKQVRSVFAGIGIGDKCMVCGHQRSEHNNE